ncbi:MAG TPA: hypothetical protein VFR97_05325 [Capillimicrobium sp.]|nr:hypothetical protein [Capillimicrobium sp.]
MGWTFLYLMVFLKLPIIALLLLVWWAIRQSGPEQEADEGGESDDGGTKRPRHPRPPLRPLPRRGPHHGIPAPASPPRTRSVVARARIAA